MNHSFEEYYKECDTYSIGFYANYWNSPDWSTPDYFNECNNNIYKEISGVPTNGFGYEFAKHGFAYTGFGVYNATYSNREYEQGTLKETLKADTIYCISFWLSHADSTNYYVNANNMGIWFIDYKSDYTITPYLTDSLAFIQQKVSFVQEDFYLENDSGWVELKMNYKARGGEKYFIIGNFILSSLLDTIYKPNTTANHGYYYLDEVSIYRCNDTLPPPPPIPPEQYVNLPNAFSPNADGENDVFRLLGADKVAEMELRVFNRWGQQVFYTNQKETGWDGSFKGQPAPTGVYAYTLVATLTNGEVITKKGNVTLKR
ncbi:MAG: gliding motility-associated C-terminal domain-containing protein [Vicingaceae bacterium]|nr:MAG: gliding motility-associated C-terminal domain-containing protein [Vicingaceae bacterium]